MQLLKKRLHMIFINSLAGHWNSLVGKVVDGSVESGKEAPWTKSGKISGCSMNKTSFPKSNRKRTATCIRYVSFCTASEIHYWPMTKILRRLADQHQLDVQKREKVPMPVEDLTLIVLTALRTTKKQFDIGRQRIQLYLFLLLAGFTVNRPSAVLALRYRHIRVSLLRDPEGGPHRLLLEFTFEFTKTFLGMKEAYAIRPI